MVSKEQKLENARIALNHAISDPDVSMAVAAYGYDSRRLEEGLALYNQARQIIHMQGSAYLDKVNASSSFYDCWEEAKAHYLHDSQIVRLVLKRNESTRYFINLSGKQSSNYEKWYAQAKEFYQRLATNPSLQTMVQQWGISLDRINSGIAILERLETARLQQQVERGSASEMIRQRDEALSALEDWMSDFRKIARIALASSPSHLLVLGLKSTRKAQNKEETFRINIPSVSTESYAAVAT